jgi:hypothetical protein
MAVNETADDARIVVQQFYRTFLKREPDPEGALTYERLVTEWGLVRAVPELLRAFSGSKEHERVQAVHGTQVANLFGHYGDEVVSGSGVNHIVSLGSHCIPSTTLKRAGLKRYSLPFDWGVSSPEMIVDVISDDFSVFLDRSYYRSISHENTTPCAHHELYLQKYQVRDVFSHRDPTREDDYQYYLRCVARFRRLLASNETKLFVIVSWPSLKLEEAFTDLIVLLERKTTNFRLLAVDLTAATGDPGVSMVVPVANRDGHRLYRFTPASSAEDAEFPDRLDEWTLLRLIMRYKLDLKDVV